ncbi:MAG: hypothetical protein H6625_13505 [Bdellovibrionaceae bacterium]|nr:hypothetical protein [Pseudobdellovibrionaceae bacterium]
MKRHFEKDNKQPLSEFQNKTSKTKSDLPSGASTNTKTIKNKFQLKRKLSYSKQAKAKIQQNEIAPELLLG